MRASNDFTEFVTPIIAERRLHPGDDLISGEPPVGLHPRICPEDTTWQGIDIPARTFMIFSINAANRDPAVYDNPHEFDITRQEQSTQSFGQGPHSCAGTWFALAETTAALTALLDRLPGLRLQQGADATVTSQIGTALRGPDELRVEGDV